MKRLVQALAGLAISGAALWLTLRGKDLGAIADEIRQADYRYLAPYLAILLIAIHLARTVRWGILLEPVAKVPFGRLNAASAVGIMALVVLPFRLGEFARPYLVAQRPALRVSAALSSVVVERVVDGIFMGLLLVVALLAVPDGTPGLAGESAPARWSCRSRSWRSSSFLAIAVSEPAAGGAPPRSGSSIRCPRASPRAWRAARTPSSTGFGGPSP